MHKVLIFEGLRLQNYTVDDFVVFVFFFPSVDYETFDILEDEEVIKLLHHCGFHCCFY